MQEQIGKKMTNSIGIIITKTPHGSGNPENAMRIGIEALSAGKDLGIFLVSDGVWCGKAGEGDKIQDLLSDLINRGAKVVASGPHLRAYGMTERGLIKGIEIIDKPYSRLVDMVMEQWDKVISF